MAELKSTPEFEVLLKDFRDDECYSLVINNLDNTITPATLQPHIYTIDETTKEIYRDSNGYTESHYPAIEESSNLQELFVKRFMTPIDMYNAVKERSLCLNLLKKVLNNHPCAIWWHNGETDLSCQFNKMHLHFIIEYKDIQSQRSFRQMKSACMKISIEVKVQKVRMLDSILDYLTKKPRVFGGCNNTKLLSHYILANVLPSDEDNFSDFVEMKEN
ncbi:hypothetical protein ACF0H5_010009 [Mactra antiquata]